MSRNAPGRFSGNNTYAPKSRQLPRLRHYFIICSAPARAKPKFQVSARFSPRTSYFEPMQYKFRIVRMNRCPLAATIVERLNFSPISAVASTL